MRFTNLQALRTIGATIVVLCHLRFHGLERLGLNSPILDWMLDYLSGPVLAAFFAMSGFVLVHSLQSTPASQFMLGRLLRIFPAYWAAIGIAILFQHWQRLPSAVDWKLIPSLLLLPVGAKHAYYPLGVEWTLVFELFFYAALGVMLLISPRRGPTIGAACWLVVVVAAMAIRSPGPFQSLPDWSEIALSPYTTPFLLGTLAVRLRSFGYTVRLAAPIAVPCLILTARLIPRWDVSTLVMGMAGALLVAWAAAAKQMSAENPLVICGEWSYGVYLLHVPIMTTVFYFAIKQHLAHPSYDLMALAGLLAIGGGLLFGRCEAALYRRLRRALIRRPQPQNELQIISLEAARVPRAA